MNLETLEKLKEEVLNRVDEVIDFAKKHKPSELLAQGGELLQEVEQTAAVKLAEATNKIGELEVEFFKWTAQAGLDQEDEEDDPVDPTDDPTDDPVDPVEDDPTEPEDEDDGEDPENPPTPVQFG